MLLVFMSPLPEVIHSAPLLAASPHLRAAALAGMLCLAGCASKAETATASPRSNGGAPSDAGASGAPGAGEANAAGTPAAGQAAGVPNAGQSAGAAAGVAGESAGGGSDGGADAPGLGGGGTGDTSAAGALGMAGASGAPSELPHITSSQSVGVMTVEQFSAQCDERGGTVEVMPHCGGFATAKGFSYDSTTELLSEHTCQGANTCAGWNCAIAD